MAQIALILEDLGAMKADVIRELRTFCALSISEVTAAVASTRPIFVRPLFGRDNPEFPEQLLSFLKWLESNSLPYKAYQVLDGQRFDDTKCDKYYVITAERLKNIISTRLASLEQQRELGRLQEGIDD
ncbi:hypothetical protein [Tautonia rosea]|uniref:hypothetical protein n=1 Tax=Tautonia rosea TaxID=2728037 RepID=UPI001474188F|nr:hypothetical protein [Tautonia rosea]